MRLLTASGILIDSLEAGVWFSGSAVVLLAVGSGLVLAVFLRLVRGSKGKRSFEGSVDISLNAVLSIRECPSVESMLGSALYFLSEDS